MISSGSASTPKSSPTAGAGPGHAARFGQHRVLERREIAQADELRAAVDRLGDRLVRELRQQAREAVAAARDDGDVGAAGGRALDRRDAGVVVAGERMWEANTRGSSSTSWPSAFRRAMPRRTAALLRTALEGEKM
jgi:hypothetical protein